MDASELKQPEEENAKLKPLHVNLALLVKMMWSKIQNGFLDFEIFNTVLIKHLEKQNANN